MAVRFSGIGNQAEHANVKPQLHALNLCSKKSRPCWGLASPSSFPTQSDTQQLPESASESEQ
eukprot:3007129-Rhodomonas_salina.1